MHLFDAQDKLKKYEKVSEIVDYLKTHNGNKKIINSGEAYLKALPTMTSKLELQKVNRWISTHISKLPAKVQEVIGEVAPTPQADALAHKEETTGNISTFMPITEQTGDLQQAQDAPEYDTSTHTPFANDADYAEIYGDEPQATFIQPSQTLNPEAQQQAPAPQLTKQEQKVNEYLTTTGQIPVLEQLESLYENDEGDTYFQLLKQYEDEADEYNARETQSYFQAPEAQDAQGIENQPSGTLQKVIDYLNEINRKDIIDDLYNTMDDKEYDAKLTELSQQADDYFRKNPVKFEPRKSAMTSDLEGNGRKIKYKLTKIKHKPLSIKQIHDTYKRLFK
jgi:hypothetical protein